MPEDRTLELLQELLCATKDGRIAWSLTNRAKSLYAKLRSGHVAYIYHSIVVPDMALFKLQDSSDRELISVEEGYGGGEDHDECLRVTKELFELATSQTLKVDQFVEEIIRDLRNEAVRVI